MKIEKRFGITMSHKFPNGDIVSVNFGTQNECESILDSAPQEEIEKFSKNLAKKVYKETIQDVKRAAANDPMIQEVLKGVQEGIASEKRHEAAEKLLDAEDD